MVDIKRGDREPIGAFVRRFSRKIKNSGVLFEARKRRYFKREDSKNKRRKSALRRIGVVREIERKKKMGIKIK